MLPRSVAPLVLRRNSWRTSWRTTMRTTDSLTQSIGVQSAVFVDRRQVLSVGVDFPIVELEYYTSSTG